LWNIGSLLIWVKAPQSVRAGDPIRGQNGKSANISGVQADDSRVVIG
jgi:hypothetical protein